MARQSSRWFTSLSEKNGKIPPKNFLGIRGDAGAIVGVTEVGRDAAPTGVPVAAPFVAVFAQIEQAVSVRPGGGRAARGGDATERRKTARVLGGASPHGYGALLRPPQANSHSASVGSRRRMPHCAESRAQYLVASNQLTEVTGSARFVN